MMRTYTVEQIRHAEAIALAQVADGTLMQRAARAVADAVTARMPSPVPGRTAVMLVGAGDNGGDALYAGAILRQRGMAVTAIVVRADRVHAGGLAALRRRGGRVIGVDSGQARPDQAGPDQIATLLAKADAIVDGLVGIGAHPPLRRPLDRLAADASASPGCRVAIDVPSGVDPDTGQVDGAVFVADITVTIGGIKTGLMLAEAAGQVQLATVGMDPAEVAADLVPDTTIMTDADAAALLPQPTAHDNKFTTGVVGIAAGSALYPGAAVLAVGGAVRLRPGLVRYVGPQADAIVQRWPEVVVCADIPAAGRVQAWVVGPGMGTDGGALARLRDVLATDVPVLVDADGLTLLANNPTLLAERKRRGRMTVLTPHAGEFARLFPSLALGSTAVENTAPENTAPENTASENTGPENTAPENRIAAVRAAAARSGAVVLLKGHRTVIADPAGRTMINATGSPWLATAGSGDVLSGVAGSLLAAGLEPLTAAALAAHLHGRAGERAALAGWAGASALLELLHGPPASR